MQAEPGDETAPNTGGGTDHEDTLIDLQIGDEANNGIENFDLEEGTAEFAPAEDIPEDEFAQQEESPL